MLSKAEIQKLFVAGGGVPNALPDDAVTPESYMKDSPVPISIDTARRHIKKLVGMGLLVVGGSFRSSLHHGGNPTIYYLPVNPRRGRK